MAKCTCGAAEPEEPEDTSVELNAETFTTSGNTVTGYLQQQSPCCNCCHCHCHSHWPANQYYPPWYYHGPMYPTTYTAGQFGANITWL